MRSRSRPAPQVVLSGTPGLRPDRTRPEDFADEARQASDNVCEALRCTGAELSDTVRVRSWLTDRDDIDANVKVRKNVISHRLRSQLSPRSQLHERVRSTTHCLGSRCLLRPVRHACSTEEHGGPCTPTSSPAIRPS
ncbi:MULTISPECIES: Rid family hydrolase [unclassified Streptomyces]|uniref:Rid family hydrolase n=1 Tax=unclassified Streptomyces TaxID=2593676 RepID=UPI0033EEB476